MADLHARNTCVMLQFPQGCQKLLAASKNHSLLLVSIGWLLCLAFLYGWHFLNKISLDWPLTLTTQPSTSKLSNPNHHSQHLTLISMVSA